jgi:hypothetical protein
VNVERFVRDKEHHDLPFIGGSMLRRFPFREPDETVPLRKLAESRNGPE